MANRPLGRPKVPVLSRERIIDVALAVVDADGLDALTTRRLADELGVKGASLYNHFANKDDIVRALAETSFGHNADRPIKGSPEQMLVRGCRELRDSLLAHPALVPVLIHQRSTGMGNPMLEVVATRLIGEGVAVEDVMLLFESLERFAIGSAIREIDGDGVWEPNAEEAAAYPTLAEAALRQRTNSHEIFDVVVAGIIRSILNRNDKPKPVKRKAAAAKRR